MVDYRPARRVAATPAGRRLQGPLVCVTLPTGLLPSGDGPITGVPRSSLNNVCTPGQEGRMARKPADSARATEAGVPQAGKIRTVQDARSDLLARAALNSAGAAARRSDPLADAKAARAVVEKASAHAAELARRGLSAHYAEAALALPARRGGAGARAVAAGADRRSRCHRPCRARGGGPRHPGAGGPRAGAR